MPEALFEARATGGGKGRRQGQGRDRDVDELNKLHLASRSASSPHIAMAMASRDMAFAVEHGLPGNLSRSSEKQANYNDGTVRTDLIRRPIR